MSQKTVVQTLVEEFEKYVDWVEGNHKAQSYTVQDYYEALNRALDAEKFQLEDAWYSGDEEGALITFQQWYNTRYKK